MAAPHDAFATAFVRVVYHARALYFLVVALQTAGATASGCVQGELSHCRELQASCNSAVLLQRRSFVRQGTASWREVSSDGAVKLLAGVPVYNYEFVERLAGCDNVTSCDLDLMQVEDDQVAKKPAKKEESDADDKTKKGSSEAEDAVAEKDKSDGEEPEAKKEDLDAEGKKKSDKSEAEQADTKHSKPKKAKNEESDADDKSKQGSSEAEDAVAKKDKSDGEESEAKKEDLDAEGMNKSDSSEASDWSEWSNEKGTGRRRRCRGKECDGAMKVWRRWKRKEVTTTTTTTFVVPCRRKWGRIHDWLVKLKDGATDETLERFCRGLPGYARCTAQGHPDEGGLPIVVVRGTEHDLEDYFSCQSCGGEKGKWSCQTEYVELDIPIDAIPEVRSEEFEPSCFWEECKNLLPSLKAKNASPSWGLDRIDSRAGLDEQYAGDPKGGKGVHVYIADTGIRTTHKDFHGRAIPTLEIANGTVRECDASDAKCANDVNGHGTHSAGTIGSKRFGVAKGATLHSMKILSDAGRGKMSYLILALDWVISKGKRPAVFTANVGTPGRPALTASAFEAAYNAGITVVVAAGNLGRDACGFTPAHAKTAITVGATENADDDVAAYSNYGSCVDVFAPGSNIQSLGRGSNIAGAVVTGTSIAAPHVTGAAALLLAEDTARTPWMVAELLKSRATQSIKGKHTDRGSPNAFLYILPPDPEEADESWWKRIWQPWKWFGKWSWSDLVKPGPMKELMAEAFVCCLFLVALTFILTRCFRFLSLPPGTHDSAL